MKIHLILFVLFMFIPLIAFPQQDKNTNKSNLPNSSVSKLPIYMEDTTEHGLVKKIQNMMNNSETIMDAQIVSLESKWSDETTSDGWRRMYTVVTFKVYHWIKGSLSGDKVTFYELGGKIGDTSQVVNPTPLYFLNQRAIFFIGNKEQNTYLIDKGRVPIFGAGDRSHGVVSVGIHTMDSESYTKILKQSVSDTAAYRRLIHSMKKQEEFTRLKKLKYGNGKIPVDSLEQAMGHTRLIKRDTTKGGVK